MRASTSSAAALVLLLDAARLDAPVGDERLERDARDLAAYRVEAGEQHGLGGVVDEQVDAGDRLEGADVAALAADDAALHRVVGQVQHGHRRLRGLRRGDALRGQGDDAPGAVLALVLRRRARSRGP